MNFLGILVKGKNMRQNKYLKFFTTWFKHNFKLKFKFSKVIMERNIFKTFCENIFQKIGLCNKVL